MIKELEDLRRALERAYEDACKKDPGLPNAWMRAKRLHPDVGWLDVAADREKRGLTG